MQAPLSLWDFNLWLAITAIILLVTLELTSPHYRKTNLLIDWRRFRNVAFTVSLLFLVTVIIRICMLIIAP